MRVVYIPVMIGPDLAALHRYPPEMVEVEPGFIAAEVIADLSTEQTTIVRELGTGQLRSIPTARLGER